MATFRKDLMSDLRYLYLNFSFEFLKHIKRKRLLMVIILTIFIPLIFYVIPPAFNIDYAETANEFAQSNLGFVTLLIIISGAVFAGDAVSGEFEKKTGLLLFPTPQRRTSIFVGKFIAALIATFLVVILYYLITLLEIVQIYGLSEISIELLKSFLLALIYSTSVVAIIFFFSSILKKTITSALLGFFLLMMILPIITSVLMFAEVDPWFIVTHSASLITDVLGVGGGFQSGPRAVDLSAFDPDFYIGIGVMTAYTIFFFFASIIIANRRKME